MKKTTKLLAVVLAAMMLLIPLSTTVFAMDMANIIGIDLDAILGALGGLTGNNGNTGTDETNGGGIDLSDFLSDPSSILSAFSGLLGNVSTEDLIGAITTVLGGGEAMNIDQLMESVLVLLGTFESTTAPVETTTEETTTEETTTEETTTEETTTEVPTTTPPTTQAPPVYTPPTYTPTTQAPETTTYTYIPPEIVTMEPLTGETYAPVIYDDNVGSSDDVTVKMVIGIVILVISGAAVVAVAIVLKKSRV
ncbi:MAG: hypothetical protein IKJ88_02685 [Clostridia bacterium]|nr:hypothetical protein [Clostridia bacterium]MBR3974746.1 hypothetical protein [Clostridia bacterium]